MAELNVNWMEALLKRKYFEDSTIRILELETSDAVGKWENFMSKIKRVKAKVLLGSGKTRVISVIVKDEHKTAHLKQASVDTGIFRREILMYRDVLPKMDDLLEEFGDTDGSLWAKCLEIQTYYRLVFEDLSMSGHKVADRKKLLDMNASLLVLSKIAKFHALSKILLERGEIPTDTFCQNIGNGPKNNRMVTKNAAKLVDAMRNWGDEWLPAIERLEKTVTTLPEKSSIAKKGEQFDFVVLNHGDCWTNNILFKYGEGSDQPIALKFVDVQGSYIGNPAADLHYFFITSVRVEDQQQYLDMMLATYYNSLESHLMKFGFEGHLPSLEEVREMFFNSYVIQLAVSLLVTPILTGVHDDMPDWEEIVKKEIDASAKQEASQREWNAYAQMTDETKSLVQYAIQNAMKFGVI